MTNEEQAIIDFYLWEYYHRGYELFPHSVDIEVPYVPFTRTSITYPEGYDDGVVPNIFQKIGGLFSSPKEPVVTEEKGFPEPQVLEKRSSPIVMKISFERGAEIPLSSVRHFLNALSYTEQSYSFEIIGAGSDITIQLVCDGMDAFKVRSQLQAYFSNVLIKKGEPFDLPFDGDGSKIAVVDFGLKHEFMLPIQSATTLALDPLTSFFGILESMDNTSVVVFQSLVKGITSPLPNDVMRAVTDGGRDSFFTDFKELPGLAKEKIESPLLSVVMRIAVQGKNDNHSEYMAKECITALCSATHSENNSLIPLPNKGYDYDTHVKNVFWRRSNRIGMILSVNELATLVHYPNKNIVSKKLGEPLVHQKRAPEFLLHGRYQLGLNEVGEDTINVSLSDEQRLSHTHIIGVTGTGKSTLLVNMVVSDMELGLGCAIFDPHGDMVDDILTRVPEERKRDVIVLDPSDTDFPLGFNLLSAQSEAEKMVLSSDLVSAFKRYATAWGDRMTSVLSNAIDTFLESEQGGTLIELKRFLLEKPFRESFLKTVDDPQLQYYWKHDYPLIPRASLSPLLIRIDTFLRPKIIRMMMAQKDGLRMEEVVSGNKILLVKLSQGLIGKDNAYLLGTLLVSKLGQVALGRQALIKKERLPFYVYMDEFHNVMSDSISEMLSGVRKYGFGLILAHQGMKQLSDNPKLSESVLANPNIRIALRLGETDAKLLQSGFSGFTESDLLSLSRGSGIMRVGGASNDFNISFKALAKPSPESDLIRDEIIAHSRANYAKQRTEVEKILNDVLPSFDEPKETINKVKEEVIEEKITESIPFEVEETEISDDEITSLKKDAKTKREDREHEQLKVTLGRLAQEHGFRIVHEEPTPDGGRVDLALHNKDISIACEISVSNTVEYEVQNLRKCLLANYGKVFMMSPELKHLEAIEKQAKLDLSNQEMKKVMFFPCDDFKAHMGSFVIKEKPQEKIIKGYRVKVNFSETSREEASNVQKTITETILKNIKKNKE